jgi:hypothetical protein
MRASCQESSHQIERSLKTVSLESSVIIIFDNTFGARLLNPPEFYRGINRAPAALYVILVVSLNPPVHTLGHRDILVMDVWTALRASDRFFLCLK